MEIEAMDYIDWDEGRDIPVEEDEPEEAECECVFTGDMADASGCELHGGAR